jgi:hypothetical protein
MASAPCGVILAPTPRGKAAASMRSGTRFEQLDDEDVVALLRAGSLTPP